MRRRLLTAAVFLLAGAVVNMAVAWGCAAWVNVVAQEYNESAEVRGSEEVWGARVWRRAGAELCTSSRVARAGSPTRTVDLVLERIALFERLRGESGVCSECGQSLARRTKVAT